jgi:hypothetical protein
VDNPLIVLRDGPPVTFVIDKGVEQIVFVVIRIARCIHGLGNDVRGEFTNVAIVKFNAING